MTAGRGRPSSFCGVTSRTKTLIGHSSCRLRHFDAATGHRRGGDLRYDRHGVGVRPGGRRDRRAATLRHRLRACGSTCCGPGVSSDTFGVDRPRAHVPMRRAASTARRRRRTFALGSSSLEHIRTNAGTPVKHGGSMPVASTNSRCRRLHCLVHARSRYHKVVAVTDRIGRRRRDVVQRDGHVKAAPRRE